jgi:ubiquinone/menaquinone biosynthesis C-methylase UbiE
MTSLGNLYSRVVFPRLCDLVLGQPSVTRRRSQLLADAFGEVLEIGFGTGLNLPHYTANVRKLTLVDPSAGMHRMARGRLRRCRSAVVYHPISGEHLTFPQGTFDCVVSTFTLCSIDDVGGAMAEVYRVLRPGGRFLFLEHGLGPEPGVQKWQRRLNRLQMLLADGCRLDRDIEQLVAAQPFSSHFVHKSYLERTPPTHGFLYQGAASK